MLIKTLKLIAVGLPDSSCHKVSLGEQWDDDACRYNHLLIPNPDNTSLSVDKGRIT